MLGTGVSVWVMCECWGSGMSVGGQGCVLGVRGECWGSGVSVGVRCECRGQG